MTPQTVMQPDPPVNNVVPDRSRSISECDQQIARELFAPLCRLLFRAWQIHQRGAADLVAYETAPPAVRILIHTTAGEAVAALVPPVSDPRLALRGCVRCGNPLLTSQERTSTHCDTCIQEFLARR